jgi:hypothetical protein
MCNPSARNARTHLKPSSPAANGVEIYNHAEIDLQDRVMQTGCKKERQFVVRMQAVFRVDICRRTAFHALVILLIYVNLFWAPKLV